MRYFARAAFTSTLVCAVAGCGGEKKPAENPEAPSAEPPAEAPPKRTSSDPAENEGPPSANACVGLEMDLQETLSKAACEVANPKLDEKPRETKGLLEVKAVASPSKVAPGGTVDITVMFTNKAKGVLPLAFMVNPLPRFSVETYDAKGKRVDMPTSEHPSWPQGHDSSPAEEKTAQIKLAENGTGRVHIKWEASKMKWAPEKAKGAATGSPYPRTPAGPLPKGKYTVRIVTPLRGVVEGIDHEVTSPKVEIEVGK